MAESLLAFGVAANIVQFIDFSSKLFSTGYELHKTGSGATHKNKELGRNTEDLLNLTGDLDNTVQGNESNHGLSQNDLQLHQLAAQCRTICVELHGALERLRVSAQSAGWKTVRAALMSLWGEKKIEDLQKRVEQYRQELILRIIFSLRYRGSSSAQ